MFYMFLYCQEPNVIDQSRIFQHFLTQHQMELKVKNKQNILEFPQNYQIRINVLVRFSYMQAICGTEAIVPTNPRMCNQHCLQLGHGKLARLLTLSFFQFYTLRVFCLPVIYFKPVKISLTLFISSLYMHNKHITRETKLNLLTCCNLN